MQPISFTAIFQPEYREGRLGLNTGESTGILELEDRKIPVTWKGAEFKELNSREQIQFSSLREFLSEHASVNKGLKAYEAKKEINRTIQINESLQAYAKAYGIPESALKFKKRPFQVPLDTIKGMVMAALDCQRKTDSQLRKLISRVLLDQEEKILHVVSADVKSNPLLLKKHLEGMLERKMLSYEKVVAHFESPDQPRAESSYVLCKLIAQCDAWAALRSKPGGQRLSFEAVWRACIDAKFEDRGAYYFENEPFYILSMLRGFACHLSSNPLKLQRGKPLGRSHYEEFASGLLRNPPIHKDDRAIKGLLDPLNEHIRFSAKMKNRSQHFDAKPWKKDERGIRDLTERTQAQKEAAERLRQGSKSSMDYWQGNALGFEYSHDSETVWFHCPTSPDIIADRIFYGLDRMLQKAETSGERLISYAWAVRELEVCHTMEDGNGRTAIFSLVSWIADDPELPIYLPEDPNILDFQGPEQLLRDIHSGMARAQELSDGSTKMMISADDLIQQAGVQGKGWEVVHKRAELPAEVIDALVEKDRAMQEA